MTTITLTPAEHATVLAALRNYQADMSTFGFDAHLNPIATNDGTLTPLDADAIDDLCERINTSTDHSDLLPALKRVLECPALNMDNLEDEDRAAIQQGLDAVATAQEN